MVLNPLFVRFLFYQQYTFIIRLYLFLPENVHLNVKLFSQMHHEIENIILNTSSIGTQNRASCFLTIDLVSVKLENPVLRTQEVQEARSSFQRGLHYENEPELMLKKGEI